LRRSNRLVELKEGGDKDKLINVRNVKLFKLFSNTVYAEKVFSLFSTRAFIHGFYYNEKAAEQGLATVNLVLLYVMKMELE